MRTSEERLVQEKKNEIMGQAIGEVQRYLKSAYRLVSGSEILGLSNSTVIDVAKMLQKEEVLIFNAVYQGKNNEAKPET